MPRCPRLFLHCRRIELRTVEGPGDSVFAGSIGLAGLTGLMGFMRRVGVRESCVLGFSVAFPETPVSFN